MISGSSSSPLVGGLAGRPFPRTVPSSRMGRPASVGSADSASRTISASRRASPANSPFTFVFLRRGFFEGSRWRSASKIWRASSLSRREGRSRSSAGAIACATSCPTSRTPLLSGSSESRSGGSSSAARMRAFDGAHRAGRRRAIERRQVAPQARPAQRRLVVGRLALEPARQLGDQELEQVASRPAARASAWRPRRAGGGRTPPRRAPERTWRSPGGAPSSAGRSPARWSGCSARRTSPPAGSGSDPRESGCRDRRWCAPARASRSGSPWTWSITCLVSMS